MSLVWPFILRQLSATIFYRFRSVRDTVYPALLLLSATREFSHRQAIAPSRLAFLSPFASFASLLAVNQSNTYLQITQSFGKLSKNPESIHPSSGIRPGLPVNIFSSTSLNKPHSTSTSAKPPLFTPRNISPERQKTGV